MTEFRVRRAIAEDAAGIGQVQVTAWREAYTGRMPQSILDGLDVDSSITRWHHAIAVEGRDIWVAKHDGAIVGFAARGPAPDAPPGGWRLYALYLLAAHHGSGMGQALLDAALGRAAASLWILEDNPRARAFYERNGFRPDGGVQDDASWGEPIREVRLVRPTQAEKADAAAEA